MKISVNDSELAGTNNKVIFGGDYLSIGLPSNTRCCRIYDGSHRTLEMGGNSMIIGVDDDAIVDFRS